MLHPASEREFPRPATIKEMLIMNGPKERKLPGENLRTAYTTGQVAKVCHVAPRTVSKWFDSGRLRGHRIPGSQDRRIPRLGLLQFLRDSQMDIGALELLDDDYRILYIGNDEGFGRKLCEHGKFKVTQANARDAVQAATKVLPMCVVIDWSLPDSEAGKAANLINLQEPYKGLAAVIALITSTTQRNGYGFDALDYGVEAEHPGAIDYASLAEIVNDQVRKKYFSGQ